MSVMWELIDSLFTCFISYKEKLKFYSWFYYLTLKCCIVKYFERYKNILLKIQTAQH